MAQRETSRDSCATGAEAGPEAAAGEGVASAEAAAAQVAGSAVAVERAAVAEAAKARGPGAPAPRQATGACLSSGGPVCAELARQILPA